MVGVISHAPPDMSMSVDETVTTPPTLSDPRTEDRDDMEREPPSQSAVNVPANLAPSEEYSQVPTSSARVASPQQPSPEVLLSLGIKVRDFAYESTLPAIIPVPRVPRQVQPGPQPLKRLQRDWDDKEGHENNLSPSQPLRGETRFKRSKPLARQPTEPLEEPVVQHLRTLGRMTVKRVCSIIIPQSRGTLPTTLRARFSASPPTSPLTPPLPHIASQESELASSFPFVVQVDDTNMIPESQPLSLHPILYTRFALDSHSPMGSSPAPNPPRTASPAPVLSPPPELPSLVNEPRTDPCVRKRRRRGILGTTPPPSRYQLRQRPIPPPHTSSAPKSLPRRTRRMVKP